MSLLRKLLLLLVFMFAINWNTKAQMGVTGYSVYALGINTSQKKTISAELKTFANRSITNLLMEADVFYNFHPKKYHRFSVGVGLNAGPFRDFDPFNAFTLPVQLEIHPLQKFRKLSLMLELAPELYIETDDVRLRTLWGIRYTFGKREKQGEN
jgi:hypothetical protein